MHPGENPVEILSPEEVAQLRLRLSSVQESLDKLSPLHGSNPRSNHYRHIANNLLYICSGTLESLERSGFDQRSKPEFVPRARRALKNLEAYYKALSSNRELLERELEREPNAQLGANQYVEYLTSNKLDE